MAKYLYSRLFKRIQREVYSNHIIRIFTTNLITILRTQFFADLSLDETQIWICIECAGIGIYLPDIYYAIQFKISNYLMLPKFF